jgi:hypothetical protein
VVQGKKPDPHRMPALKYHFGNHGKVRCVKCQEEFGIPGPLLDTTNIAARRTDAERKRAGGAGAGLTATMNRNCALQNSAAEEKLSLTVFLFTLRVKRKFGPWPGWLG